jgi:hypothetical protein
MSVSNDSTGTIDDGRSFTFVGISRSNDLSILPELGKPFKIRYLSEKEDMKLADALFENASPRT